MKLRMINLSLVFLTVFLAAVAIGMSYHSAGQHSMEMAMRQVQAHGKNAESRLSGFIRQRQNPIAAIAQLSQWRNALLNQKPQDLEKANLLLDNIHENLKCNVSYLMNLQGEVIASSNRNEPKSFLGKNYAFRPYFQDAILGRPGVLLAKGVTSGKQGLYLSNPVYDLDGKTILGVLVVKERIENFCLAVHQGDMTLDGTFCTLVSPGGEIFLSTAPGLTGKLLWKSGEGQAVIKESEKKTAGQSQWSGMEQDGGSSARDRNSKEYIFQEKSLRALPGWRVAVFFDRDKVAAQTKYLFVQSLRYPILFAFFCTGFLCILLYRMAGKEIKKRRESETALQKSEGRLKEIFGHIDVGVVVYRADEEGKEFYFSYLNKKAEQISRVKKERILGSLISEVFPGVHEMGLVKILQKVYQTGVPEKLPLARYQDERLSQWVSNSAFKLPNGEILVIYTDETSHVEALQRIKEKGERLRKITQNAHDAVIIMNHKGEISFWNPAAEKIFGYGQKEALGRDLHDMLLPERFKEIAGEGLKQFYETGTGNALGRTMELVALHKDGREIPIELSLSAMKDKEEWSAVGLARDISDRKEMHQALEVKTLELQKTNDKLSKALDHSRHSAQVAKRANQAKSEFLANMSHEIRTPMNGVIGMGQLLRETNLDNEQAGYVKTIMSSSESLLLLINDILDFSKIEAGKMELDNMDFDIRNLMEDATEPIALKAYEKNLEFTCLVEPDVPSLLRGDPGKLRQIINNLVFNAIKFTQSGHVGVHISLQSESKDGLLVRFEVTDTGIGVPAEKVDHIFGAFEQADNSTTRKYGGTGLGLAICKRLARMMGGEVGCRSKPEKGSVFWFTAMFKPQLLENMERQGEDISQDLCSKRILIVDDNQINRIVIQNQLAFHGLQGDSAPDALAALEMLRNARKNGEPYWAVIVDMQMPGMDGLELGRKIRNDAEISSTRLLLLTSLGLPGSALSAKKAFFDAYLTKPTRHHLLYECLHAMISNGEREMDRRSASLITRHTLKEKEQKRYRILIAEDNTTNQMVVVGILKKLGYNPDTVSNGRQAVSALERTNYDLVLMDAQMPVMDGFIATRTIRGDSSRVLNKQVPIIALTAMAMHGDKEKCLQAGMDGYLTKPLNAKELAKALETHLKGVPSIKTRRIEKNRQKMVLQREDFDRNALMSLLDKDEDLFQDVLSDFVSQLEEISNQLMSALEGKDYQAMETMAHSLKGAASSVYALAIAKLAGEIEERAPEKNMDLMEELTRELCFKIEGFVKETPLAV